MELLQTLTSQLGITEEQTKLSSSLGAGAGQLAGLASLAGGFKSLNLDSGMVAKFIPIVLSFVQSKGGRRGQRHT